MVFRNSGGAGGVVVAAAAVGRYLLFSLIFFILYLLQTCGPARLMARGSEFALPFVLAVSAVCGPTAAGAYGLAAGMIYDAQSGLLPGVLTLAVFWLCIAVGAIGGRRPGFWPYMICAAGALACLCAVCMGLSLLSVPPTPDFFARAAVKLTTGLLFSPLCYLIARTVRRGPRRGGGRKR